IGDFNWDGWDDIFVWSDDVSWRVFHSNGDGTFTQAWSSGPGYWGNAATRFLSGDFNGDGKDDLFAFEEYNGAWTTWSSNGNGTFTGMWSSGGPYWGNPGSGLIVGDFNGDRRDDVFGWDGDA